MNHTPSIYDFAGFSEVAETTTQLLTLAIQQANSSRTSSEVGLGPVENYVLLQARDYLSTVREGFTLSVRSSRITRNGEIGFLLDRILTDWDQLSRELGLDDMAPLSEGKWGDGEQVDGDRVERDRLQWLGNGSQPHIEQVRQQLLAFGMAVIAMGYLPQLPSKRVTFPKSYSNPPTYRDIPVPHTPAEMLCRIEEMEETVGLIMSRDLSQLIQNQYGPLRRTYGFFETSAWLSAKEVRRFGVKKEPNLTLL